MELAALPAFADNYIWMLHDGQQALVVDPGEAGPVIEALRRRGLKLTAILVTHHHADHIGGLGDLRAHLDGPVFGPATEAIPGPLTCLREGDSLAWNGLGFEVIDVPGHTAGHIAYWCADLDGAPLLFCGDTLFSAGCGRLFEGTPAQMHRSLSKLASLPGNTRVCCTHEYTLANLRFAQAVEAGNAAIDSYTEHCEQLRAQDRPTLPSSIAKELQVNPFLRVDRSEVITSARAHGAESDEPVAVFAALRHWKNNFK